MTTVYKYPLVTTDAQSIAMRRGAKITHVGLDPQGVLCLWAMVDPDAVPEWRRVFIVGTGNPIPPAATEHVGSVLHGPFMWHVFMEPQA